jgi:rhodanese-related sulfurtransferase
MATSAIALLDGDALKRLLETEKPLLEKPILIDVRTSEEYHQLGHIPGARLLPLHTLPQEFSSLNPEIPTVLICQHGVRSWDAACYLHQQGFSKLYSLDGGMSIWDGPIE